MLPAKRRLSSSPSLTVFRSTPCPCYATASIDKINQSFGNMSSKSLTLTSSPGMPYKYYQQHQREIGAFFKDDWKFRPYLTLNLGVHWEYYGQPFEHSGLAARIIGDDASALTKITCTSSPGTPNFSSTCSKIGRAHV